METVLRRAELDRAEREFGAKVWRRREGVEAKAVNVEAVLSIGQPRTLAAGGVSLRAPPLSYQAGVTIYGWRARVRHRQQHPQTTMRDASLYSAAAAALLDHVEPVRGGRWLWRVRMLRSLRTDPAALIAFSDWLLMVPDDAIIPARTPATSNNLLDHLLTFVRAWPEWLGPDGLPRSWAHYVHGLRHLAKEHAREDLRHAIAVRIGGTDGRTFKSFADDWRYTAGWAHG